MALTITTLTYVLIPLGVLVVLAALLVCSLPAIRGLRRYARLWKLKRERAGQTFQEFVDYFAGQGVPEEILRETYPLLSRRVGLIPHFPVHPQDSLYGVYSLNCFEGDDLSELMEAIEARCPLKFCLPVAASQPCETVADLVRLLAARCPAGEMLHDPALSARPFRDAALTSSHVPSTH